MTTIHFSGFADSDGRFFKALAKKNDRAWFAAHKDEYERGWNAPMKLLLGDVRAGIDRAYSHTDLDEPKVFRIFRDVRFSKDKSPYKTHIGGFIAMKGAGRKPTDLPMPLYVHVGDDRIFCAAGYYMMAPPALERFRKAIADDKRGKELQRLIAKLETKGFATEAHETLKRVPKGYDPAHPRAELLKSKGLVVTFPKIPRGLLVSPKLSKWIVDQCKTSAPLVEWLIFATA